MSRNLPLCYQFFSETFSGELLTEIFEQTLLGTLQCPFACMTMLSRSEGGESCLIVVSLEGGCWMLGFFQYIKAHVGPYQMLRSLIASVRSASPFWNEDLLFVAMEPFDDLLHILVQDRVGNKVSRSCSIQYLKCCGCGILNSKF